MPTNTTITVHSGRTAVLFVSGRAGALLVADGDDEKRRLKKLEVLDELYDHWVDSTYDKKKSPNFRNGHPHGFLDGYSGSLFFIEDEDEDLIVLAHVFEDLVEDEYDNDSGRYIRRPITTGVEAAKAYKQKRFEGKRGVREYLEKLGLKDIVIWHVRYKNGHTYP